MVVDDRETKIMRMSTGFMKTTKESLTLLLAFTMAIFFGDVCDQIDLM